MQAAWELCSHVPWAIEAFCRPEPLPLWTGNPKQWEADGGIDRVTSG